MSVPPGLLLAPAHRWDRSIGQTTIFGRFPRYQNHLSGRPGSVEHMFEATGRVLDPQVTAQLDEQIERCSPSTTPESAALVDRICAASRAQNRAAAAQLQAIGE